MAAIQQSVNNDFRTGRVTTNNYKAYRHSYNITTSQEFIVSLLPYTCLQRGFCHQVKKHRWFILLNQKFFIYSLITSLAFPALQLVCGWGWTSWEGFPLWLTSATNGFVCAYKNKIHMKCLSCKAYWSDSRCQTISKGI